MLMDCTVKTVDRMIGATNDYRFGSQIAPLGDLNQDGCEDVAIGANLANLGPNNQGAIHIVYGWGGAGCPANPTQTVLVPGVGNGQAGFALDAGQDFDGDGIPDVAVGAFNLTVSGANVGAAW